MKITNNTSVPLALAVWAVNDSYDYVDDPKYISVTSLLKPLRQIILQRRVDMNSVSTDVEDFLARAMGTSIHDSIEKAWIHNHETCLKKLGYDDNLIQRIKINPEEGSLKEKDIPIYLEKRKIREIDGWKIGGKFDFVADGLLHDNKSTTTMKWQKGSSDKDYCMQGSIYRWLNPDIIKDDIIRINYVFTDWSKLSAIKDSSYPQHRAMYKDIPLLTYEDTEKYIKDKLSQLDRYMNAPEQDIPECGDEELWRTPTVYKYYSNPANTRPTKNFETMAEAKRYQMMEKKGQGIIKIVPGEPRRCHYCNASSICSQYKRMFPEA